MLKLDCPWCGLRTEDEFTYAGPADLHRPQDPAALTDAEWSEYLFMRSNARGLAREIWRHGFGCQQWFLVDRDTETGLAARTSPLERPVAEKMRVE